MLLGISALHIGVLNFRLSSRFQLLADVDSGKHWVTAWIVGPHHSSGRFKWRDHSWVGGKVPNLLALTWPSLDYQRHFEE